MNTIKKLFKIFMLIILIVPMMIPPQEVKGKTINGLQQEINDAIASVEAK